MPSEGKRLPRSGPLPALLLLAGLIAASLLIAVAAEGARIAWLEGAGRIAPGLNAIVLGAWLTDALIILLAILFFWALTNRVGAGVLMSAALTGVLLFAHVQKVKAVGKPLAMSDLALVGDVLSVAGGVVRSNAGAFCGIGVCLVLCMIALVLLTRRPARLPIKPAGRVALIGAVIAFFASGILEPPKDAAAFVIKGVEGNGFLGNFLRSPGSVFIKSTLYSKNSIQTRLAFSSKHPQIIQETSRPDIILYFGESFMELGRLNSVRFDIDPTPNFHDAIRRTISGRLTSPETGGATANVEFESFTGIPIALLPLNAVPYHHNIDRPIEALPTRLADAGYWPLAFHNFDGRNYTQRHLPTPRIHGVHRPHGDAPVDSRRPLSFRRTARPGDGRGAERRRSTRFSLRPRHGLARRLWRLARGSEDGAGRHRRALPLDEGEPGAPGQRAEPRRPRAGLPDPRRRDARAPHGALLHGRPPAVHLGRGPARGRLRLRPGRPPPLRGALPRRRQLPAPRSRHPRPHERLLLPAKILRAAGIDGGPYFRFLESRLDLITAMNHNFLLLPDGREFLGPSDPKLPPEVAKMVRATLDDFTLLAWDRLSGEEFSRATPATTDTKQ